MGKDNHKIWFPATKYGYGWGLPSTWQGWAVLLTYLILVLLGSLHLEYFGGRIIPFLIYLVVLTVILIFICWKKGEKPEWRWGDNK